VQFSNFPVRNTNEAEGQITELNHVHPQKNYKKNKNKKNQQKNLKIMSSKLLKKQRVREKHKKVLKKSKKICGMALYIIQSVYSAGRRLFSKLPAI
jgi:hypothetical protein